MLYRGQAELERCEKRGRGPFEDCFSLSGAPDEPRERAKAMLRPYQASRHLRTVLRRQLQRHFKEIQEHGGAGLRVPLTRADLPAIYTCIRRTGDQYKKGGS